MIWPGSQSMTHEEAGRHLPLHSAKSWWLGLHRLLHPKHRTQALQALLSGQALATDLREQLADCILPTTGLPKPSFLFLLPGSPGVLAGPQCTQAEGFTAVYILHHHYLGSLLSFHIMESPSPLAQRTAVELFFFSDKYNGKLTWIVTALLLPKNYTSRRRGHSAHGSKACTERGLFCKGNCCVVSLKTSLSGLLWLGKNASVHTDSNCPKAARSMANGNYSCRLGSYTRNVWVRSISTYDQRLILLPN